MINIKSITNQSIHISSKLNDITRPTNLIFDYNLNHLGDEIALEHCINNTEIQTDDGNKIILPQTQKVTRSDGIIIEISDSYNGDIYDDENQDFSEFIGFEDIRVTIIDNNGLKHEYGLFFQNNTDDVDILDIRREISNVINAFSGLSEKTMNKILSSNLNIMNVYCNNVNKYKYDPSGIRFNINSLWLNLYSQTFAADKRNYNQKTSFITKNGCECIIEDDTDVTSKLTIKTPNGDTYNFKLEGLNTDTYHKWQLPKFKKILDELSLQVLKDLNDEIDTIRFMNAESNALGGYAMGSNTIAITIDKSINDNSVISFVHELGHGIDNQNNTMLSKTNDDLLEKFERFKTLCEEYEIKEYCLSNIEEFFASTYAYQYCEDEGIRNHVRNLLLKLDEYKYTENPEQREMYDLCQELINDISNCIDETRTKTYKERHDNSMREIVRENFGDIIEEFNNKFPYENKYTICQSIELEILDNIFISDEEFEKRLQSRTNNLICNMYPEYKDLYVRMYDRLIIFRKTLQND